MALKTYTTTYKAADGSTRFRISTTPPTTTTTTTSSTSSSSTSSSSSSGNIKTGTNVTGQATYTTTDGRSFNDATIASQEQAKINASQTKSTTTSKSLIDSNATDKLTIIDTSTGKVIQQGTSTPNYSPFPQGSPSGFEQIKKMQETGTTFKPTDTQTDKEFAEQLKKAMTTDSSGRITTLSNNFSYDPAKANLALRIFQKTGSIPLELKNELTNFVQGTIQAQNKLQLKKPLSTTNEKLKKSLEDNLLQTNNFTAKQAFQDSETIAQITKTLFDEGKLKTQKVNLTTTKLEEKSFDQILAKSYWEKIGAERNNILKIDSPIIDFFTQKFVGGSAFVSSVISEVGGVIGKRTTQYSLLKDIELKEKADKLGQPTQQTTFFPDPFTQKLKEQEFQRETFLLGARTKTITLKELQKTKEDYKIIELSDYKSDLAVGEQAGRITAQTIPYIISPVTGFTKSIIDVGSSRTKEQLVLNVGLGALFGATTKIVTSTGKLIPLTLNKYVKGTVSLTKKGFNFKNPLVKFTDKTIQLGQKFVIPAASTGLIATSGLESIKQAKQGNFVEARNIEKDIFSTIGGMKLGAIAGDIVGLQLQRPIQQKILYETGTQTFKGVKKEQFIKDFDYVFKELPKKALPLKEFKVGELGILERFPKTKAKQIASITEKTLGEFKAKVIGSGVIVPQTRLSKTPKGKIGDIDAAKGTKELALTLQTRLNQIIPKGFKVDVDKGKFQGTDKYYVSIKNVKGEFLAKDGGFTKNPKDAFEFINVGTSLQPTGKQFDAFENLGIVPSSSFRTTKSGTEILSLTSQAKAKFYGGYFGGREKDLVDLQGIIQGTKGLPTGTVQKTIIKTPTTLTGTIKNVATTPSNIIKKVLVPKTSIISTTKNIISTYKTTSPLTSTYKQPSYVSTSTVTSYAPLTSYKQPLVYKQPSIYKQPNNYKPVTYTTPTAYKTPAYTTPPYNPPTTYKQPPYNPPTTYKTPTYKDPTIYKTPVYTPPKTPYNPPTTYKQPRPLTPTSKKLLNDLYDQDVLVPKKSIRFKTKLKNVTRLKNIWGKIL